MGGGLWAESWRGAHAHTRWLRRPREAASARASGEREGFAVGWELPSARWWRGWARGQGPEWSLLLPWGPPFSAWMVEQAWSSRSSSPAECDKIQPRAPGGGQSPELTSPSKAAAGPARVGEADLGHHS